MVETTMPTAEAEVMAGADDERQSYELAFHVLPTVVEGEVPAVFNAIKQAVTDAGGELFDEEAPQRFDLAYEIVKHLEGKNRRFTSAYFGWIRFKLEAGKAKDLVHAIETRPDILRALMIRLTRAEEANPFRFHEALAKEKRVTTIEESDVAAPADTKEKKEDAPEADSVESESEEEKTA